LGIVGVAAPVCHAQHPTLIMFVSSSNFVLEWFTPYGFTALSRPCRIATLHLKKLKDIQIFVENWIYDESWNNTVELSVIIIAISAVNNEIFTSFWRMFAIKFQIERTMICYNSDITTPRYS
jgi:hypothetical protein